MIHAFRARNYGCLADVTAELTPLHAFIGPNDSGKSTLLQGLRTVIQLAGSNFHQQPDGAWEPFDPYLPTRFPHSSNGAKAHDILLACDVDGGAYELLETAKNGMEERVLRSGESSPGRVRRDLESPSSCLAGYKADERVIVMGQLRAARLTRFDPDALRRPSGLIPETESVGFLDERGLGLAGVYFALRNRDDNVFSTIVEGVRRHFPTLRGLRVKAVTSSEVVLEAELVTGVRITTSRMSEGLLYYLAFAALRYLDPVSLLLVEEPENGLHPARIGEVMRILRAIVDEGHTQVVMATHSPLVVNELRPEEVSVVTRKVEEGTRVKRIKDTPDFEERAKVYALGELWIAYANGEDEAPLLEGTEP